MQATTWDNPVGTDGFEFIEYTAPDPVALGQLFEQMGFTAIARHRHKKVTLYRQGEINFLVNAEPDSFAQRFARLHGPSICAIATIGGLTCPAPTGATRGARPSASGSKTPVASQATVMAKSRGDPRRSLSGRKPVDGIVGG